MATKKSGKKEAYNTPAGYWKYAEGGYEDGESQARDMERGHEEVTNGSWSKGKNGGWRYTEGDTRYAEGYEEMPPQQVLRTGYANMANGWKPMQTDGVRTSASGSNRDGGSSHNRTAPKMGSRRPIVDTIGGPDNYQAVESRNTPRLKSYRQLTSDKRVRKQPTVKTNKTGGKSNTDTVQSLNVNKVTGLSGRYDFGKSGTYVPEDGARTDGDYSAVFTGKQTRTKKSAPEKGKTASTTAGKTGSAGRSTKGMAMTRTATPRTQTAKQKTASTTAGKTGSAGRSTKGMAMTRTATPRTQTAKQKTVTPVTTAKQKTVTPVTTAKQKTVTPATTAKQKTVTPATTAKQKTVTPRETAATRKKQTTVKRNPKR